MSKLHYLDTSPAGLERAYRLYREMCIQTLEAVFLAPAQRAPFTRWLRRRWNASDKVMFLHESPFHEVAGYLGIEKPNYDTGLCERWSALYADWYPDPDLAVA